MSSGARRITMAAMLLASLGFARLGVWQLAGRRAPPVPVTAASVGIETLREHRVVAEGRYDSAHEIILRGAVLQGAPGVRVVTPLLLADRGPAVLVERGFLPAPDAISADTDGTGEPGEVTVRGLAQPIGAGPGEPLERAGRTTWRRLDLEALRRRLPYAILPIVILQSPDTSLPAFPRRFDPPPVDDGPHLSYAIQWFLFAGLGAGFAILIVGRTSARPNER